MHVALEEPELVDELSADYPAARPRRYGACLRLGLGERMPCVFMTCRFNLLADEIQGPRWDGESELGGRPTCALLHPGKVHPRYGQPRESAGQADRRLGNSSENTGKGTAGRGDSTAQTAGKWAESRQ